VAFLYSPQTLRKTLETKRNVDQRAEGNPVKYVPQCVILAMDYFCSSLLLDTYGIKLEFPERGTQ